MDTHTPPHIAPAPVDGVVTMPDPPKRKFGPLGYSAYNYPFMCADYNDLELLTYLFGTSDATRLYDEDLRTGEYISTVLVQRDPEGSYAALKRAFQHVDSWLRTLIRHKEPMTTMYRFYCKLAIELQRALRELPDPTRDIVYTPTVQIKWLLPPIPEVKVVNAFSMPEKPCKKCNHGKPRRPRPLPSKPQTPPTAAVSLPRPKDIVVTDEVHADRTNVCSVCVEDVAYYDVPDSDTVSS